MPFLFFFGIFGFILDISLQMGENRYTTLIQNSRY